MAELHGPPVVTKARDLMTWLLNRVSGFPRTHRFVLGERIRNLAVDVLERLRGTEFYPDLGKSIAGKNLPHCDREAHSGRDGDFPRLSVQQRGTEAPRGSQGQRSCVRTRGGSWKISPPGA